MLAKLYRIPLIEQPVIFYFCNGDEEIKKLSTENKEIKKQLKIFEVSIPDDTRDNYGCCFRIIETGRPIGLYVSTKLKNRKSELIETIAHECTHLVYHLQRLCNFKEENEMTAYISGRLIKDFIEFTNSYPHKSSNKVSVFTPKKVS